MSTKTVTIVLSADVATNGTFTVAYPTGYSKGSFSLGTKHVMNALQNNMKSPKDFTVSFGATTATVTYKGATTLPQGSTVYFGFDIPGPDNFMDTTGINDGKLQVRPAATRLLNLGSPLTASTTAFLNAATGATFAPNANTITYTFPLLSTASFVGANLTGVQDVPRNVVMTVTHASAVVASTAVITALDIDGNEFKETLTATAGTTSKTATGKRAAAKITSIAITSASDATANSFSFGFGTVLGLPILVPSAQFVLSELMNDTLLPSYGSDKVILPYAFTATEIGAATTRRIAVPSAGTITKVVNITQVADTASGTLKIAIADGNTTGIGTAVAGANVLLTSTLAAGAITTTTPTAGSATATAVAGQQITIVPGANLSTGVSQGFVEFAPSKTLRGTFVAGVFGTTGSATTGDVRGTYDPETAPDGTNNYALLVALTDAQSNGTQQFDG